MMYSAAIVSLVIASTCDAFMIPRASLIGVAQQQSSIAADIPIANGREKISDVDSVAWDCDKDANCVEIDACNEERCRTSLDVRIHGNWYDLSGTYS